ncbi:type I phosphomannose isomerase catalytic subunit [Psychroflexus tropicus]|uniref:type I phosphomannose isomerase catalytic subunit n=1 Tax=Psychroflexus tropicus TaxID=197345 RepID=UPI00035D2DD8|nr:type I phosphomannose isomerase catalytic subunit [Psychroflexus tropicus]
MLYPLKFKPILKEKIWGGNKLHFKSFKPLDQQKIGESWELSNVPSDVSIVENGHLEGYSLQELILKFDSDLMGKSVYEAFKSQFPILIKFIEAKQKLSVQLHPDDKLAKERHNSFGKTEMWYITDAEPDSKLIIDFKNDITVEDYKKLLEEGQIESALNSIPVKEGNAFFIKPGLVHAIGSGVLLAEIQQTSDITYRIFDWNRTDSDGNSRELHTDLALKAIDFSRNSDYRINYTPVVNSKVNLAESPYFKTNFIQVEGTLDFNYSEVDSFIIYMNVGREKAVLNYNGTEYFVHPKETILVPACLDQLSITSTKTKLLEISI